MVFGEYIADITHNYVCHILLEEERSTFLNGYRSPIKALLLLQRSLKDVGAEDDSDSDEEVEIFSHPNMEESDANE